MSAASVWEAAIETALGRFAIDGDLVDEIAAKRFSELAISARQAQLAASLPRHHDDPVDRLLAAQAQLEGLCRATLDEIFGAYGVAVLS